MAPKFLRAVCTCLLRQSRPLWTMCCQQRVLKQLDGGEAVLGAEAERRGAGSFDLPEVADKRADRVAARGGCNPGALEELRVEPQDVAAVSAGGDAVGAAVVHER